MDIVSTEQVYCRVGSIVDFVKHSLKVSTLFLAIINNVIIYD